MPRFDPQPITLENNHVRLEPLLPEHAARLADAFDPSILRMSDMGGLNGKDLPAWIAQALDEQQRGSQVPYAIVHRGDDRVVGSTRFMDIQRQHRGLEIGTTWISPTYQRTVINTACKLLLLSHAFEELQAIRVQFRTDRRNAPSQRAIERIGATHEGVLRQHMVLADGRYRDSVCYSIIDSEWDAIRSRLITMMTI